jgi:murein DD-endopeptidase MepM/ murein hydrolase activator NlpD
MKKTAGVKRILIRFAAVLSAVLTLIPSNRVLAESRTEKTAYEKEIEASDKKKKELEKAAARLLKRVEDLDPDKSDLELYILTVDNAYADLFEEYRDSEKELEDLKKLVEASKTDLEEKRSIEAEKYAIMKERVRYMYEEGNVSFTDVLFGSTGLSDFLNRLEYRYRIMKYDNEIYSNYENAREKAEISEKLLSARLDELEALQEFREAQIASLESIAEKKAAELLKTSKALSIDTYELFANWDELMETDDVTNVLEGIHEEDMASYMLENIMWPLPGKKYISSHYGYREAPTEGATIFHSGIDIPATTGTEAKAALSGVVVAATYDPGSGNFVKISHGNGVYTSYCHASKLMVKVGDRVKKGQTVILVGSTGVSTGPHLHFGVQIDGYYRNPLDYVWYGKE